MNYLKIYLELKNKFFVSVNEKWIVNENSL
jgi:hypothetical protein